jgi:hypothetical protein
VWLVPAFEAVCIVVCLHLSGVVSQGRFLHFLGAGMNGPVIRPFNKHMFKEICRDE